MDVQALAPGGLLDPNGHVLRRPTSCRPRLMRGMYRINEHDRFIGFEAVQKLLVARDESLLLRFVKLARHALRLVIDKTKPMQQCDQPRVAIAKLIILPKPGPNRIRAAGQPRRDKGFQSRLLLVRQLARTAFMAEIPQSRHALPLIDLEPLAHRVVVQQKRRPDLLAVPAVVQKNNRVRPPRHPVLHKAIPRDRYQCASLRCGQKSRANHQPHPNPPGPRCQPTASRVFVESRYSNISLAALLQATRTVPIVFLGIVDPVGSGFVNSLSRPGGNATGFMLFDYDLSAKWLELLKEIAPGVTRAAVLRDSAIPTASANSPSSSPCRGQSAWR